MKLILSLLFFFFIVVGYSQQTIVSGTVKDLQTGEPLIGANVFCTENKKVVSTDVYGFFKLEIPSTGAVQLIASFVGYRQTSTIINVANLQQITLSLEPGLNLEEISVRAIRPIEERLEMGAVEIPVHQIKSLPMFGEPDVLKAMQLLPGVQGGSDGRNGLYVRGGSADQNLFMLDGSSLYYVNHLGGFVSVFHPDILKNVKLYKGAFPARFGGRLSSVIDLRMKDGNKKEHHGSWGIGLISGDVCLEGPLVKDKTSYIVSLRRVWLDLLMRPTTRIAFKNFDMGYNFYDFYGKISHEQDANNRFYLSFYGGDDRLGYNYNFKDEKNKGYTKYLWGNILSTMRWNHIFNPRLSSDITLFYTRYRYKIDQSFSTANGKGSDIYLSGVHDFGLKTDFSHFLTNKYKIKYGAGISGNWFKPGQISYENTSVQLKTDTVIGAQNQLKALNTYFYLENEIELASWLTTNAGVRLVNYNVNKKNYSSVEPRLLVSVNMNNWGAIKLAYSKMMQPVHLISYSGSIFPTDIWLPSSPTVAPGKSVQYSIGYAKYFYRGNLEFSIEAYKKDLKNLIEVKGGSTLINTDAWDTSIETNGTGNAKGLEFMLQKKLGNNTGWISYTWSKSERQFEKINNGKPYPFKYDRRHDVSVVFSHKLSEKIDFSATWVFGSGYPTTLQNGIYRSVGAKSWTVENSDEEFFDMKGEAYLYPDKNWLRMRAYHRLDLGVNFNKQKGNKIRTWTIGIYNAYNRQNAVFYYYGHRNQHQNEPIVLLQQSGFPIIPTVKYSIKF